MHGAHFRRLQHCMEQQQEQQYHHHQQQQHESKKKYILDAVYTRMENALDNNDVGTTKSEYEKAVEHAVALNEFGVLRDRMVSTRTRSPALKSAEQRNAIEMMPKSLQCLLMRRLREHGSAVVWLPCSEVTIDGQWFAGSNMHHARYRTVSLCARQDECARGAAVAMQTLTHPPGMPAVPGQQRRRRRKRLLPKCVRLYEGSNDDNDDDARKRDTVHDASKGSQIRKSS